MLNLSSSNYTKVLNINGAEFSVNFSKDCVIKEILDLQEVSQGKNILDMKDRFISSLRVFLGNDCIEKIYGSDEPQAKTLQDCINYIIKEWSLLSVQGYGENFKELNTEVSKYERLSKLS